MDSIEKNGLFLLSYILIETERAAQATVSR